MKITIFFPILLCQLFSLNLFSQCRIDTVYNINYITGTDNVREINRGINFYNQNNQKINTTFEYNINNNWTKGNRNIFSYDNKDNLTQELRQNWSVDLSNWINNVKYDYKFDSLNNEIEKLTQFWNTTNNEWYNYEKISYSFIQLKYKKDEIIQNWVTNNNLWENIRKINYKYDSLNNLSIKTNFNWWNYDWLNSLEERYYYDSTSKIIEKNFYKWQGNNTWTLYNSGLYQYSVENQFKVVTFSSNEFTIIEKFNFENKIIEYIRNDYFSNTWRPYIKNIYTYSNENNLISIDFYSNWSDNMFLNKSRAEYKCQAKLDIDKKIEFNQNSIFPNPIIDNTLFIKSNKYQNFEIFNILGEKILNGFVEEGTNEINLNDFENGTYLIKFEQKLFVLIK